MDKLFKCYLALTLGVAFCIAFMYSVTRLTAYDIRKLLPSRKASDDYEENIDVWDPTLEDDRIEAQINYVPSSYNSSAKYKGILAPGGLHMWGVDRGDVMFKKKNCLVNRCYMMEPSHTPHQTDAVLVMQSSDAPKQRPLDQIWIFYALESPTHLPSFSSAKHLFNWTATYRHDSTIVTPYAKWYKNKNISENNISIVNYAENKTKMVAWFVSNCGASNGRMSYANNLSNYIQVDIYGGCGTKQCPRDKVKECGALLKRDYKFYLAFENSNCKDYITEKFYHNALRNNVIPVVMGAPPSDYRRSAPPHSFIHVDDFESPAHLAQYLFYLHKHDDKYNEYFNWKGTGKFASTQFWCRMCTLLHDADKPILSVPNLGKWFAPKDVCQHGEWKATDVNKTQTNT